MLRITTQTYGKPLKILVANLQKYHFELQDAIIDLGRANHAFMVSFIQSNKKRPPGVKNTLEDAISFDSYAVANNFGFAIGDISKLNQEASYWHAVNYGGKIPPKSRGMFHPGDPKPSPEAFRDGRWYESEGGVEFGEGWLMKPKKPIPAMNYIEASHHMLRLGLAQVYRTVRMK